MQINDLKSSSNKSKRKRLGRGGKLGTYCGRGVKGQKARSGSGKGPSFQGNRSSFLKLPKKKGFKSIYDKLEVVNLTNLDKKFKDGEIVNPRTLVKKEIFSRVKRGVKILGMGDISKKLVIERCQISKTAEEKIKKAGGEIRVESQESL